MTLSPVSSTWTPPGQVPLARQAAKNPEISLSTSSKWRVLRPPSEVNVLPCIGSQTHTTGWPDSFTARWSGGRRSSTLVAAHPADKGQPARLALGVEDVAQCDKILRGGVRPDLGRDGVVDPRQEVQVRTVELTGPLPAPDEVRRCVVPAPGEGVLAGQGLLVAEDQGLVARVEVDLVQALFGLQVDAASRHETKGAVDLAGDRFVALTFAARGDELLVPHVHLAKGRQNRPW